MQFYDGSAKWDEIESILRREGYVCMFDCRYGQIVPHDVGYTGRETGWDLRRKIKRWCAAHHITDYRIVRNTSYHRDLVGIVYELWTKPSKPVAS